MFHNYFKTTYRHFLKNKINFGFKLGGLTLALFSFLVIAIYVSYQLSFDKFHEDFENIYRVNSIRLEDGKLIKYATVPPALGAALKSDLPEVKSFAGVSEWGQAMVKYNDKLLRLDGFVEADSTLFDVFTFKLIKGNAKALNNPSAIVITESLSKMIFGEEDPLNKLISFPDRFNRLLEVKAVIEDLPTNSSLNISAIMNFGSLRDDLERDPNPWEIGWGGYNLFLRMNEHTGLSDFPVNVKALLKRNLAKSFDGREKHFSVFLQPLSDIYLGEPLKWEFDRKGNSLYVYIYSGLAIFLLIIASINFLNLSIADFNFRNKEIGVRKVLGARKKQIAFQVTFETTLYCLFALIGSFGLLYIVFPQLLKSLDPNLQFAMIATPKVLMWIVVVIIFLVLFSAAYPAYRLSINNPIQDLKRKYGFGGKFSINKTLLLAQFSISVFCLCATWAVGDQLRYIQTRDIGFDRNNLITVLMPDRYPEQKAPILKDEINKIPGVETSSFSYYHITGVPYFNAWYKVEIGGEMKPMLLNELFVDPDFLQTMEVKLLKGRNFVNKNEFKTAYIINESAVKEFGWSDPIGKRISIGHDKEEGGIWAEGTVIGVVKDFNTQSLHKRIEPLVMRLQYDSWPGYCLNIRYTGSEKEILASIKTVYEQVLSGFLLDYNSVKERYDNQYQNEKRAHTTLQACTWIIVLISCIGIFSMAVFMSLKRVKEFGIRKVLGATVHQIASLHINYFLRIVLLSNFIAIPIAYWLIKEWLNGFAYRAELNSFVFLLVFCFSFLLVIISAGSTAWKAGRMNPVDVIKME